VKILDPLQARLSLVVWLAIYTWPPLNGLGHVIRLTLCTKLFMHTGSSLAQQFLLCIQSQLWLLTITDVTAYNHSCDCIQSRMWWSIQSQLWLHTITDATDPYNHGWCDWPGSPSLSLELEAKQKSALRLLLWSAFQPSPSVLPFALLSVLPFALLVRLARTLLLRIGRIWGSWKQ